VRRLIGIAALASFGACAMLATPDEVEPGRHALPGGRYEVELPAGWFHERAPSDQITVVREGVYLSQLVVCARPRGRAFPCMRKEAKEKMTPAALAELALGETRALALGEGVRDVEVLENRAIEAGGRPAFLLHLRIEIPSGLDFDHLQAGFVEGEKMYWIWFRAPTLHYFERDRHAFDRAVETIRRHRAST